MNKKSADELFEDVLSGHDDIRHAFVCGRWARWLEGREGYPRQSEPLLLAVVTVGESSHDRLLTALATRLESHPEVSEVFFTRISQDAWREPKSDFEAEFKKCSHKWLKISLSTKEDTVPGRARFLQDTTHVRNQG